MASFNLLKELQFLGTIAVDLSVDQAELEAGQTVTLPAVQVGSVGGRPVMLSGTLSLG